MARGFTADDVPDQSGRTILVTGANTGIGFEAAAVLAGRGARVLLGCRDASRAADALSRIQARHPDADIVVVPLDQGNLASVADAAAQIAREPRLDVLINNAGIMMPPLQHTTDGFESQLGVNHLGTFALTCQLLGLLDRTPDARVVVTSSLAHRTGQINLDDLGAEHSYDRQGRYQQSKLANLLFAFELQRRLIAAGSGTAVVACHPGIAATELGRHFPAILRAPLMAAAGLLLNTPAQGAWPTLMAATSPDVGAGGYVGPSRRNEMAGPAVLVATARRARDEQMMSKLWERSVQMTGIDPGI
jgi:NAD(P)-dependent dehydrogenase (short-subunit alcohol dehydrogenase family)